MIPTFFLLPAFVCFGWLVGCLSKSGPSGGELWATRCDLVLPTRQVSYNSSPVIVVLPVGLETSRSGKKFGVIFWPQKPIRYWQFFQNEKAR